MTERIGAVKFGEDNSEPFLGRDIGHTRNYSEEVAATVDGEVKALLTTAHQEAFDILVDNRDVLDALVLALLERETLDKGEVAVIFEPVRRRPARPPWTGSPTRIPSTLPPVKSPNGTAPSNGASEGASSDSGIIVAPGPDGDLHGGWQGPPPGTPPTPPSPGA
jgi:cell division protease FtsH